MREIIIKIPDEITVEEVIKWVGHLVNRFNASKLKPSVEQLAELKTKEKEYLTANSI